MLKGWTAGIIDGEGCVRIEDNRGVIKVYNTDYRIVETLKKEWGGSLYESTRSDRPRSKRIWTWALTGKAALKFLIIIEPFLISRGERAREVISLYSNRVL